MEANWKRGRHKATPIQKVKAAAIQKKRVKISNMVARCNLIEKKCCICGKPGNILHNKQNPYYITFMCKKCRQDKNKVRDAEDYRFDIRDVINQNKVGIKNFTDDEIRELIENYPENTNMGAYCKEHNISRYLFNKAFERYCKLEKTKAAEYKLKIYSSPKIIK